LLRWRAERLVVLLRFACSAPFGEGGQGKEQGRDALIFSSNDREREDEGGELMMCFVLAPM